MSPRKLFLQSLFRIADDTARPMSARQATAAFRKAMLHFGSETDDNRSCAAEIVVTKVSDRKHGTAGLALRGKRSLVSHVLNDAEGIPVPRAVRKNHPGITQREWDAVLRLATLVFISFERS